MSKKKTYRFFYHLNKPETKKQNRVVWTIHWKGVCTHVHDIRVNVPTFTRSQTKRQPWAVVVGDASEIDIDSALIATIR